MTTIARRREPSHYHHPRVSDRSGSSRFDAGDRSDSCNDCCDSEPRNPIHGYLATRYEPVEWGCHSPERANVARPPKSATFRELSERASTESSSADVS